MPSAKEVKKRFLEIQNLDDVRDFFVFLDGDFRPHSADDGLDIDISDSDYLEVYVYKERSEIEKRARRGTALRYCQLALSPDFADWTFVRHGVEGRVRLLKYRIQKDSVRETENPMSMQRLAKLAAGRIQAFEDLFERKDISSKFYSEYSKKRVQLIRQIAGIEDDADRKWFAQVLLDRIIFLYFLQKKGILNGDERYLIHKLQEHVKEAGKKGPSYYRGFLMRLFFETLCTKPVDRPESWIALTGKDLPYLNGGLFLKHDLEEKYPDIDVDNRALSEVFQFLEGWLWHVSERAETDEDAIDPYILGYIFEKSIGENKSQGVYYTPPFLSEFLARETIQAHLLRYANKLTASGPFGSLSDVLIKSSEGELIFIYEHLREITVCDPACGSGQFLVQALHELARIHETLIDRGQKEGFAQLIRHIEKDYALDGEHIYGMRRFIVAHNLYGVDLLSEAVEITKLRLFVGMVEGLEREIREPLPNIDFNIRAGNSLIGFTKMPTLVRETKDSEAAQFNLDFGAIEETFHQRELKILSYYNFADPKKARELKTEIQKVTDGLRKKLNKRLDQFINVEWKVRPSKKIDFVDMSKDQLAAKAWKSYELKADDCDAFHWVMEFSNILSPEGRAGGGFDVVLLNPPWEIWKPNSQEFFEKHIDGFRGLDKNEARKAVMRSFEKQKHLRKDWINYSLSMSAVVEYFRECGQYPARGQGSINLYKLFLECSFQLLKHGGSLGIVMPNGFYSDAGCGDLRRLFFENSAIHFLYGFENSKAIFEDVHRSFKFVLFSATNDSADETTIPAAFTMRTESDLISAHSRVPDSRFVELDRNLIKKLSPNTLSLLEFRSNLDIHIVEKMALFPRMAEEISGKWNVKLSREFHMTDDAPIFVTEGQLRKKGAAFNPDTLIWTGKDDQEWWPLFEGKMIWHYDAAHQPPRYWVPHSEVKVRGGTLAWRDVASDTNERTLVATYLPPKCGAGNSLNRCVVSPLNANHTFLLLAYITSFCADFYTRLLNSGAHVNIHVMSSIPIPRFPGAGDHPYFQPLVEKAAALVGTTAAYDELLREVFGEKADHKSHGVTDSGKRQKIKNEIDAMVAKIYDLTGDDLEHILASFPLVEEDIKTGVLDEWKKL